MNRAVKVHVSRGSTGSRRVESNPALVLNDRELATIIHALRSVGNVELAERCETLLRRSTRSAHDRWWTT